MKQFIKVYKLKGEFVEELYATEVGTKVKVGDV